MNRRGFLRSMIAAGFAPAAVGSGILMPVKKVIARDSGDTPQNNLLTPASVFVDESYLVTGVLEEVGITGVQTHTTLVRISAYQREEVSFSQDGPAIVSAGDSVHLDLSFDVLPRMVRTPHLSINQERVNCTSVDHEVLSHRPILREFR